MWNVSLQAMSRFKLLTLLLTIAATQTAAQNTTSTTTTNSGAAVCAPSTGGIASICGSNPTATPAPQTFTIDSSLTVSGDASTLLVGSATLVVGGPAYTDGSVTLSLGPSGVLDDDGTSTSLSFTASTSVPTNDDQTFTLAPRLTATGDASSLALDSTTLTPGDVYTTGSLTVSLGTSGIVDVDGSSTTLPTVSAVTTTTSTTSQSTTTTNTASVQLYTVEPDLVLTGNPSSIDVGSATLTPSGPPVTIGLDTLSLGPSGVLVVDSSTTSLALPTITTSSNTASLQTYSIAPGLVLTGDPSAIDVGSSTLTPSGPPIITGSETLSLGPSGILVIDGSTTTLPSQNAQITTTTSATSTMTTTPPGLSLETWSGTQPTANEWLTTTDQSSSTTVVPVIVPCPSCDAIIVWGNLPAGVDFQWPQFPQLPKFRLPCLINCGSPPVNDGPPESPDPTTQPTASSTQQTTQTTDSTTSTTTSSDQGVETQVVDILQISLEPTVVSGSTVYSTTTFETDSTTLDTRYTSGIATRTETITITGTASGGDLTIPTPAYDDFNTSADLQQVIMSIASAGMASEDSVDASTTAGSTNSTTSATASSTTSSTSSTIDPTTSTTSSTLTTSTLTSSTQLQTTSSTTTTAPTATATYDPNSLVCKTCGTDLGASNCPASDGQCLVNQCKADVACQACGIDCNIYA